MNDDITDKLKDKIIFSLESNDIGYNKNGPIETLNASFSAKHYVDPTLISAGKLDNILNENEEGILSIKH